MAHTKLGETVVNTSGDVPAVGASMPHFTLIANDLKEVSSSTFTGKKMILNIFPSIDTGVCSKSVREFNKRAASLENTVVLCISKDLPFAMRRFCGAEGIDQVITLSDFRNLGFASDFGVEMMDGGFKGLLARVVIVVDQRGVVTYSEIVPSIGQEPNYEGALQAL